MMRWRIENHVYSKRHRLHVLIAMNTCNFKVVVRTSEKFDGNPSGWHAYCPLLERWGASTWGTTQSEAVKNIDDVVRLVVESMLEHGEPIPEEPKVVGRLRQREAGLGCGQARRE